MYSRWCDCRLTVDVAGEVAISTGSLVVRLEYAPLTRPRVNLAAGTQYLLMSSESINRSCSHVGCRRAKASLERLAYADLLRRDWGLLRDTYTTSTDHVPAYHRAYHVGWGRVTYEPLNLRLKE